MDTSGSMRDEAAALCSSIDDVIENLGQAGFDVTPVILGITQTPGGAFACLFDTVVGFFGDTVPGPLSTCPFPNGSAPYESWGPATAIVAEYYPWRTGTTRIIVPISDEGPCNGSRPEGCNDPGEDRDSITNAAIVAQARNVIVSPIAGTSSDACVINLGADLAAATGGQLYQTKDPLVDFEDAIASIIEDTCVADDRCDDDDPCTADDRCHDGRCYGEAVEGCRECLVESDCGDQNSCTMDACVSGFCEWTPTYNVETECCNPANAEVQLIEDTDPCTFDHCDPNSGDVTHTPGNAGATCDDGFFCTYSDVCDQSGNCQGINLETKSCSTNSDCLGLGACDLTSGFCDCNEFPTLTLEIASETVETSAAATLPGTCYAADRPFDVNVTLGMSASTVAAGQLYIQFDPSIFSLMGVTPGSQSDATSPFSVELLETINAAEGTVFYAVTAPQGHAGTHGPAVMATLHFEAPDRCALAPGICFTESNSIETKLTDPAGQNVPFEPRCTLTPIEFSLKPDFTCPGSVVRNADAGRLSTTVLWSAPTMTSPCGSATQVTCQGMDPRGLPIDALAMTGGIFSVGTSHFECTAVDSCGQAESCEWIVEVRPEHTFIVDLELSAPMTTLPLVRCIEFEFYSSCLFEPVIVRQPVLFGGIFNYPGNATNLVLSIPAGQTRYLCATARDPLHTLRSASSMTIVGTSYFASFVGDPKLGGNWLIGGNLNGDRVIDILDHGTLVSQYLAQLNPNTTCEDEGPHSDINGNGTVSLDDLSFINRYFLTADKETCCGTTTAGQSAAISEISLNELSAMGYGDLSAADTNGDGVLDEDDIAQFLRREAARIKPSRPRD